MTSTEVEQGVVTGVKLRNEDGSSTYERTWTGIFVAIGHIPNTEAIQGKIELESDGYIVSHGGARTRSGGLPRRGRAGPPLPSGDHGGGVRVRSSAGSGEVPRGAGPVTRRFTLAATEHW